MMASAGAPRDDAAKWSQVDWAQARGAFVDVPSGDEGETVLMNRGALRFSNAYAGARGGGKKMGADNRESLIELVGASPEELDGWEQRGVLAYETEATTDIPWK